MIAIAGFSISYFFQHVHIYACQKSHVPLGVADAVEYTFWLGCQRFPFCGNICGCRQYFPSVVWTSYVHMHSYEQLRVVSSHEEAAWVQCSSLWYYLWWILEGGCTWFPRISGVFVTASGQHTNACMHVFWHTTHACTKGGVLWNIETSCRVHVTDGSWLSVLGSSGTRDKFQKPTQPKWCWSSICDGWKQNGLKVSCMHGVKTRKQHICI